MRHGRDASRAVEVGHACKRRGRWREREREREREGGRGGEEGTACACGVVPGLPVNMAAEIGGVGAWRGVHGETLMRIFRGAGSNLTMVRQNCEDKKQFRPRLLQNVLKRNYI